MKVATWNVNGIRARHTQVQEWVEREQPDIVCLQEIKAAPDQVPAALCEMEGYWCYWHGAKGYSGVGLHVRKSFSADRPAFDHPAFDYESRIVTATVRGVTFASIYVPNGGKDYPAKVRFLESLRQYTADLRQSGQPAVLCGDLNIARTEMDVHPKERKPRAIGQLPENAEMFTWWAPWRDMKARNIGWRLDYVLASADIYARVEGCAVQREVGTSDHGPVVATFTGFEPSGARSGPAKQDAEMPAGPGRLFAPRDAGTRVVCM